MTTVSDVEAEVPASGIKVLPEEVLDEPHRLLVESLQAMSSTVDDKVALRTELLLLLAEKPDYVECILRLRWEPFRENLKNSVTNEGVISALVLSVVMGLAVSPLNRNHEEDSWAEVREVYAAVYYILMAIAALCAAIATVNSLLWLNWSQRYVLDADDFVRFIRAFPHKASSAPCAVAMVCGFLAIPFANVVVMDEWIANIVFPCSFLFLIVVLLFLKRVFDKVSGSMRASKYNKIVKAIDAVLPSKDTE